MILKEEEILESSHIPSSEIEQDIKDTQKEIDDIDKEIAVLKENPIDNRVDIYTREGRVLKRLAFIGEKKQILAYRNK